MSFNLEDFAEYAIKRANELGCNYCDVRAENSIRDGITIENGHIEYTNIQRDSGIGIRVLNSNSWVFFPYPSQKQMRMSKKL